MILRYHPLDSARHDKTLGGSYAKHIKEEMGAIVNKTWCEGDLVQEATGRSTSKRQTKGGLVLMGLAACNTAFLVARDRLRKLPISDLSRRDSHIDLIGPAR